MIEKVYKLEGCDITGTSKEDLFEKISAEDYKCLKDLQRNRAKSFQDLKDIKKVMYENPYYTAQEIHDYIWSYVINKLKTTRTWSTLTALKKEAVLKLKKENKITQHVYDWLENNNWSILCCLYNNKKMKDGSEDSCKTCPLSILSGCHCTSSAGLRSKIINNLQGKILSFIEEAIRQAQAIKSIKVNEGEIVNKEFLCYCRLEKENAE